MASTNQCLASLARMSITSPTRTTIIPRFLAPAVVARQARTYAVQNQKDKKKEKKKVHKTFRVDKLDQLEQFSLCDAIRYVSQQLPPHAPIHTAAQRS